MEEKQSQTPRLHSNYQDIIFAITLQDGDLGILVHSPLKTNFYLEQ